MSSYPLARHTAALMGYVEDASRPAPQGVLASCAQCGRDVALDSEPSGRVICRNCELEGCSSLHTEDDR